jgi:hypothetical protein
MQVCSTTIIYKEKQTMRVSPLLRVVALCVTISILAASMTSCGPDNSTRARRGGFFDGLIAPLSFIPVVVSGLLDPEGIDKFNQHLENR